MKQPYRKLMKRCFELADEAKKRGDTAVGSLLTDANGEIIAEASEQNRTKDLFAHAEFLVIQTAIKLKQTNDLTGCVLLTTNEPCFLCSFAIRQTSISRVVFAHRTSEIGGVSSKYPILSANDIGNWKSSPEIVFIQENQNETDRY
jgi:tRNA(adenine34) deaminase